MDITDIPKLLRSWIVDIVTYSVRVGHVTLAVDENFQNLQTYSMYRTINDKAVTKWIDGAEPKDRNVRAEVIRKFVADTVRTEIYQMFPTADYPAD